MVGCKIDLDNVSGIVRLHARQPCVAARQLWEDQRTPNICFQYLSHLHYWRPVSQAAANYLQEINLEFLVEVIILHLSRLSCGRCWPGRYNNCQSLSETGNKPCLPPLSLASHSQGALQQRKTQLPLHI